jgi:hypothetical protein
MAANGTENRRHPRYEIPLEGTIIAGGVSVPCQVRNISVGGAFVEVKTSLRVGHLITVKIPEIGSMTGRVARVTWRFTGIALQDADEAVDAFIVEWLAQNSQDDTQAP